ncbi:MAG: monofunctional biosynthetic peptidoglycan transglycosylase [Myxococcota bacterium]
MARAAGLAALLAALAPGFAVALLRVVNPPTSAFILRDDVRPRAPRRWTPIERIAPALQVAVIASEDQKFPEHRGFDFAQIERALLHERRGRGASTITQQVAKNLFLTSGRSLARKGLEAYLTVWIEALWPKRRILEVYLNVAEFGPGVFGVAAASRQLFGTEPAALSTRQAALLAAVLPSPKRLSAGRPSPWVAERASEIERSMRRLGGASVLARL